MSFSNSTGARSPLQHHSRASIRSIGSRHTAEQDSYGSRSAQQQQPAAAAVVPAGPSTPLPRAFTHTYMYTHAHTRAARERESERTKERLARLRLRRGLRVKKATSEITPATDCSGSMEVAEMPLTRAGVCATRAYIYVCVAKHTREEREMRTQERRKYG